MREAQDITLDELIGIIEEKTGLSSKILDTNFVYIKNGVQMFKTFTAGQMDYAPEGLYFTAKGAFTLNKLNGGRQEQPFAGNYFKVNNQWACSWVFKSSWDNITVFQESNGHLIDFTNELPRIARFEQLFHIGDKQVFDISCDYKLGPSPMPVYGVNDQIIGFTNYTCPMVTRCTVSNKMYHLTANETKRLEIKERDESAQYIYVHKRYLDRFVPYKGLDYLYLRKEDAVQCTLTSGETVWCLQGEIRCQCHNCKKEFVGSPHKLPIYWDNEKEKINIHLCHDCEMAMVAETNSGEYFNITKVALVIEDKETLCKREDAVKKGNFYKEYTKGVFQIKDGTYLKPYHCPRKWKQRKLEGETTTRYFGIELEHDGWKENEFVCKRIGEITGGVFRCETDSSLRGGQEAVSDPCTIKYISKKIDWSQLLSYLTSKGYRKNSKTAGLHVHVTNDFQKWQKMLIALFVSENYDELTRLWHREPDNKYCESFGIPYVPQVLSQRSLRLLYEELDYKGEITKYRCVNFTRRRTIEFRFFGGTLYKTDILSAVQFVDCLAHIVSTMDPKRPQLINFTRLHQVAKEKKYNYLMQKIDRL